MGTDLAAICRIYFSYSGTPPTSADCNALAGFMATAWNTNVKALMSSANTLETITVTDLNTTSGAQGSNSPNQAGTRTGTAQAAQVCIMAQGNIARRYRGGKPRTFWPLLTITDLSNEQKWIAASATAAQTGLNNFIAGIVGQTSGATTIAAHVNVSYYQGFTTVTSPTTGRVRNVPKLRPGGPITDVISSYAVSLVPGTQRRRLNR